jgi:dTDP-4-dehydrorhamnose 3,5-epimerase
LKFTHQLISDVIIIDPLVHGDDRGYFVETFRQDLFEEAVGYQVNFIQDNESKSTKGVLRGLHYQIPPYGQSKLVRVLEGRVLDVAVDIRKNSPTFGQHIAIELSSENMRQIFIPQGFAHGFAVLSEIAIINYRVDNLYSPEHEKGIAFNDLKLNIDWRFKMEELKLSEKDRLHPNLEDAIEIID